MVAIGGAIAVPLSRAVAGRGVAAAGVTEAFLVAVPLLDARLRVFGRHARRLHAQADDLGRDLRASRAEAERWRSEAHQALAGLSAAMDRQFERWGLTEAECEVAVLLLKGLSHKEIAQQRGTGDGTVRQQALSVYQKSGADGRAGLAAFFLQDLALPRPATGARRG